MGKLTLTIIAVSVAGVFLLISPFIYFGLKNSNQRRALQNRSDVSQIATACVALARSVTNYAPIIRPSDPRVPPLLRSLAPRYISVDSNHVAMEFHGGFDHYGYRVRQSDTNPALWTLSWYTEQGERLLTTVTQ